jgi:amino acid adenylation domain-containing protein
MPSSLGDQTLHGRFLRGLAESPGRPAIRSGGRILTYEEAHGTALAWAGAVLRDAPVPPRAVGVLAGKGPDSYVGILAALYAGAAAVPLQPDFPAARTRRMMTAAGVAALIADPDGLRVLPALETGAMPVLRTDADRATPTRPATPLDEPRPAVPSDTAYILFTSGSTGRPKGVPITHGNLHHYFTVMDARHDFTPDDVFSQAFDPTFDCAMFDLFAAWGAGAQLLSVPSHAYADLPGFLTAEGVTVWYSTPSVVAIARRRGGLPPGSMPTLRWSLFAGDALTCDDALAWQEAATNATVVNQWGPTETTITCSTHLWSSRTSPGRCVNGIVPLGTLHDGHDFLLLGEDGRATEKEGEVCVVGPQVIGGYLDPDDDRNRFVEHEGRRWYRTGDRVRLADDGELVFLGRIDTQVQIQGWRVEPAEIDHHLRGCPGVDDAVTVAVTVDGEPRLAVFYTGAETAPADFARALLRTLPQNMLPRHYWRLDELPLNGNRKIDRLTLRARADDLLNGTPTAR